MIFASIPISMIFWAAFVVFTTAYVECIKNFSRTLRKENLPLWEELYLPQAGAERINHGKIFKSFMRRGDFRSLNNTRTSRAAFCTGITGVLAGLSGSALFWYYALFLPYHK
jgi:hypothetical protein